MIDSLLIEVQGDIYTVQNIDDDKVKKLILSVMVGQKLSIRWLGNLVVQYMINEPYYCMREYKEKSIVTLYCDRVVS